MPKRASNGNCFMCGKTTTKTAIKNHICKEHDDGDELCYLVKAEGTYNKEYWLFFTVSLDATLNAVDNFLRQIWCECCGHLSAFRQQDHENGKTTKISKFNVGDKLQYDYDFGSTTEITLTFVGNISRPKQREKILLLARNEQLNIACETCQSQAVHFNALEGKYICEVCAEDAEDEEALLPIVNSPRIGECAYSGEQDRWTFQPDKPFPQKCSGYAKNRSRGIWVYGG